MLSFKLLAQLIHPGLNVVIGCVRIFQNAVVIVHFAWQYELRPLQLAELLQARREGLKCFEQFIDSIHVLFSHSYSPGQFRVVCSFRVKLVLQVLKFLVQCNQSLVCGFWCREGSIVASFCISQRSPAFPIPTPKKGRGFGKPQGSIQWIRSHPPALVASMTLKLCDDISIHRVSSQAIALGAKTGVFLSKSGLLLSSRTSAPRLLCSFLFLPLTLLSYHLG